MRIGVLSLQGGVTEHIKHLIASGVKAVEVKKITDLDGIHGLILPGGESTTLGILMRATGLLDKLKEKISCGFPVWGTCAGMILLSRKILDEDTVHIGLLDVEVKRNGYGRQIDSFTIKKVVPEINEEEPIPLVFIRAPYITKTLSNKVEILSSIDEKIVAVRQDNILATAFHPELTDNLSFHKYFINHCLLYITDRHCNTPTSF